MPRTSSGFNAAILPGDLRFGAGGFHMDDAIGGYVSSTSKDGNGSLTITQYNAAGAAETVTVDPTSHLHLVSGAPGATVGRDDDWALDPDTSTFYRRSAGAWSSIATIRGFALRYGTSVPAAGLGRQGDWYVKHDTGAWYEKTGAAAWTSRFSLAVTLSKASNADVDGETDDTDYMTVLKTFRAIARKVKTATATVRGIILLARAADIDDATPMTEASRAVTPSLLQRALDKVVPEALRNRIPFAPPSGSSGANKAWSTNSSGEPGWNDFAASGGEPGPRGQKGDKGDQGKQGTFRVRLYLQGEAAPAAPSSATYDVDTDTVTVNPSVWTRNTPQVAAGNRLWAIEAPINPANDSGTINLKDAGRFGSVYPVTGSKGNQGNTGAPGSRGPAFGMLEIGTARFNMTQAGRYYDVASDSAAIVKPNNLGENEVLAIRHDNQRLYFIPASQIPTAAVNTAAAARTDGVLAVLPGASSSVYRLVWSTSASNHLLIARESSAAQAISISVFRITDDGAGEGTDSMQSVGPAWAQSINFATELSAGSSFDHRSASWTILPAAPGSLFATRQASVASGVVLPEVAPDGVIGLVVRAWRNGVNFAQQNILWGGAAEFEGPLQFRAVESTSDPSEYINAQVLYTTRDAAFTTADVQERAPSGTHGNGDFFGVSTVQKVGNAASVTSFYLTVHPLHGGGTITQSATAGLAIEEIGSGSETHNGSTWTDTGIDLPATIEDNEIWAVEISGNATEPLFFFRAQQIHGATNQTIGQTFNPEASGIGFGSGLFLQQRRGTTFYTLVLGRDSAGNLLASANVSAVRIAMTLWRVQPGSGGGGGSGEGAVLSDLAPLGPGAADAGDGDAASREDHVHPRQTSILKTELETSLSAELTSATRGWTQNLRIYPHPAIADQGKWLKVQDGEPHIEFVDAPVTTFAGFEEYGSLTVDFPARTGSNAWNFLGPGAVDGNTLPELALPTTARDGELWAIYSPLTRGRIFSMKRLLNATVVDRTTSYAVESVAGVIVWNEGDPLSTQARNIIGVSVVALGVTDGNLSVYYRGIGGSSGARSSAAQTIKFSLYRIGESTSEDVVQVGITVGDGPNSDGTSAVNEDSYSVPVDETAIVVGKRSTRNYYRWITLPAGYNLVSVIGEGGQTIDQWTKTGQRWWLGPLSNNGRDVETFAIFIEEAS